jgi:hypothetical protein
MESRTENNCKNIKKMFSNKQNVGKKEPSEGEEREKERERERGRRQIQKSSLMSGLKGKSSEANDKVRTTTDRRRQESKEKK